RRGRPRSCIRLGCELGSYQRTNAAVLRRSFGGANSGSRLATGDARAKRIRFGSASLRVGGFSIVRGSLIPNSMVGYFTMTTHTFYVFFHGTIPLYEEGETDSFRAFLVGMRDHRIAVGHFLTERTIHRGATLTLTGVEPGE